MQPFDHEDIAPSKPVVPFNYLTFILLIHCSFTESRRKSFVPRFLLLSFLHISGKEAQCKKAIEL